VFLQKSTLFSKFVGEKRSSSMRTWWVTAIGSGHRADESQSRKWRESALVQWWAHCGCQDAAGYTGKAEVVGNADGLPRLKASQGAPAIPVLFGLRGWAEESYKPDCNVRLHSLELAAAVKCPCCPRVCESEAQVCV